MDSPDLHRQLQIMHNWRHTCIVIDKNNHPAPAALKSGPPPSILCTVQAIQIILWVQKIFQSGLKVWWSQLHRAQGGQVKVLLSMYKPTYMYVRLKWGGCLLNQDIVRRSLAAGSVLYYYESTPYNKDIPPSERMLASSSPQYGSSTVYKWTMVCHNWQICCYTTRWIKPHIHIHDGNRNVCSLVPRPFPVLMFHLRVQIDHLVQLIWHHHRLDRLDRLDQLVQ